MDSFKPLLELNPKHSYSTQDSLSVVGMLPDFIQLSVSKTFRFAIHTFSFHRFLLYYYLFYLSHFHYLIIFLLGLPTHHIHLK